MHLLLQEVPVGVEKSQVYTILPAIAILIVAMVMVIMFIIVAMFIMEHIVDQGLYHRNRSRPSLIAVKQCCEKEKTRDLTQFEIGKKLNIGNVPFLEAQASQYLGLPAHLHACSN